ncbi:MAG TPA: hypothetical protein VHV10_04480, partial [Ktedonobacteraceae bacterium]|nr:hypothetical protein [Ktedonobacteraceae bacterium]
MVKNAERISREEVGMPQDLITQIIDTGQSAYMALLFVPYEIGITRGTLKKYLTYLGIEPI